jgi:hypothetical protein
VRKRREGRCDEPWNSVGATTSTDMIGSRMVGPALR